MNTNVNSNVMSTFVPMASASEDLVTALQFISSIPAGLGGVIMLFALLCGSGQWFVVGGGIMLAGLGLMELTSRL